MAQIEKIPAPALPMRDIVSLKSNEYDNGGNTHALLDAVFNTSSLALHVLESIRDESGNIEDFRVILTNKTSEMIAGKKVMGMRMLEGWPHTKEIGLFEKFVETVNSGVSMEFEQMYEGDGVKAWFRWIASQLNDGLYVTIEDISDRKRYEEQLSDHASKLKSTFDSVPAMIALLDVVVDEQNIAVDFIVAQANKATADFSNTTLDNVVGKHISHLYGQSFSGDIRQKYFEVYSTGVPLNMEFFDPQKNIWLAISVRPQDNQKGLIVVATDISSLKKAAEEQHQAALIKNEDKVKTEFFSNISHELRTPLSLITGSLEDVLNSKPLPKAQLQKLEMVKRNALRLQRLTNTLLDFSRIAAGKFEGIFQPTHLGKMTAMLAANFQFAIEKVGLKFTVRVEDTEPIYINRNMWEKIVFNLLSNALKYTFKGNITVILKSCRKHIQLHVCDTGVGISSENLEKIFERFTRIEHVKGRSFQGTGIGLALVKELVAMHRGNIRVKSKPGIGSEFIVSIPKGKKHLSPKMIHEIKDQYYESTSDKIFLSEIDDWTAPTESTEYTKEQDQLLS